MSRAGKIAGICELIQNAVDGIGYSKEFEIIDNGDKIGLNFVNDYRDVYAFHCSCCGERFPFDFSTGSNLYLRIFGSEKLKTLDGLPVNINILEMWRLENLESLKSLSTSTIRTLSISDCGKLSSLEGIPSTVKNLELNNLHLKRIDFLPKRKMNKVEIAYMIIDNYDDINTQTLCISLPPAALKFDKPLKCSTLVLYESSISIHFSNIDGLREYKGTIRYAFSDTIFDFKNDVNAFKKFEQYLNENNLWDR